MSALVTADPIALDLVHRGTLDLSEQLKVAAGEVGDALDVARQRCLDHLGGLPDVGGELLDLACRALDQADLARRLAEALRAADTGAVDHIPSELGLALGGGLSLVFGEPSLLPPVLVAYARDQLERSGNRPLDLHPVLSALIEAKQVAGKITRSVNIARATGAALGELGLDVGWTRWAQRGSVLSQASRGAQILQAASAAAVASDLATLIHRFANHASAADKVDAGLQLGLDGSIAACRLAPNPWTCLAVGVTGVAWGGFKVGREVWDHRKGLGTAAGAVARGATVAGQVVVHDAAAVGRGLRQALEHVASGALHSGQDLLDLAGQLRRPIGLMPPIPWMPEAPARSVAEGFAALSGAEHAVAQVPGKVLSEARSVLRWIS